MPLRLRRPDAHHACGERTELARQVLLAEALVRPGCNVVDGDARHELHLLAEGCARAAREDVDLDAALGQPLRRLDDVDVETAGVARSGLRQRGGVDAHHGHVPHGTAAVAGRGSATQGLGERFVHERSNDTLGPCIPDLLAP